MSDIPLDRPYSPELVEAELKEATLARALWRIVQIGGTLLTGLFFRMVDRWAWTYRRGESREDRQHRRAQWLLGRVIWLGPAFVKVGQALATRPDLLPLTYIQVLAALHDRLPPFPNEIAFGVIESELGWRPQVLFDQFDPDPCAAASLGQVYHARTHEGEDVAVKVQRPDLVQAISVDLALVRRLAALLQRWPRLGRGQPWVRIVDEFGTKLFEELDYLHEAHLAERFRANAAGMPGVYVPRIYREYTSRHVLTLEYVEGIKITDKERLEAAGVDVLTLLRLAVRANLRQLFEHGLFHADPHPGNLLVRPHDSTLVWLDFGMMGSIRPDQKLRIIELFVDVINRRPENLKENLIALGFLHSDARWDELVPHANTLFKALFGSAEGRHTFQEVTSSFAPLIYEYEFTIPADFAYIVRAIMTLEGISLQLDPGFDIWAVSAPYAARMMLTFPDPSLRQRLMDELLTADGRLDWQRLGQLAALATRDDGFKLEAEGLAEPVLDMLLAPEGAALRRALVADILSPAGDGRSHVEELAPLLAADRSLSGRTILDRLARYLVSPEGEETRAQLAAGLRSDGSLSLSRVVELAALAGRLHPEFRLGTLIRALGTTLLSEPGRAVRNQLLIAGAQRLSEGLRRRLSRAPRSAPPRPAALAIAEGKQG